MIKNKFSCLLLPLLLVFTIPCTAATLSPFFISYDVKVYGEPGAIAYLKLEQKSPTQFVLQGVGEIALTLEGIRKSKTTLTRGYSLSSELFLDGNRFHPSYYKQISSGVSHFFQKTHTFDWKKKQVQSAKGKRNWVAPVENSTYDPLSLYLALKQALRDDAPLTFTLPRKDELKTYTFIKKGNQKLKTTLGELETIHLVLSEDGGDKITNLWFASKLDFHLVKANYNEKGALLAEANLHSFTLEPGITPIPTLRPMTLSPKQLGQLLGDLFNKR